MITLFGPHEVKKPSVIARCRSTLHKCAVFYHTKKFKATAVITLVIVTIVLKGEPWSLVLLLSKAADFIAAHFFEGTITPEES